MLSPDECCKLNKTILASGNPTVSINMNYGGYDEKYSGYKLGGTGISAWWLR